MPAYLSDREMDLFRKECRLAGAHVSYENGLTTILDEGRHYKYIRYNLAARLGAHTWYYQGYYEGLKFVSATTSTRKGVSDA
jgi:hypothetical protein